VGDVGGFGLGAWLFLILGFWLGFTLLPYIWKNFVQFNSLKIIKNNSKIKKNDLHMLPNKTFIIDVEVSYCTKAPSYYLKLMLDCFRGVSTPRI
jgi:hypothetical protein